MFLYIFSIHLNSGHWPVILFQDCLNDCIYQIERTKQANGGGVPSVYEQAVMNQRSEIKTNELPQLPLPNQTKEAPGHQPPLSPESPEKSITPTEVLEVDVLVTWSEKTFCTELLF